MRKFSFQTTVISACGLFMLLAYMAAEIGHSGSGLKQTKSELPFCTILPSSIEYVITTGPEKWVGQEPLYWPKKTSLKIYFYQGTLALQERIKKIANEWALLAGFEFNLVFTTAVNPQIRISFRCAGYNSLVGKQNLESTNMSQPTMCLQGLDTLRDDALFKRTVLHEFGHVMGLLHELQSPIASIPWDTTALYSYYKRVYNWGEDSVNKWVLALYSDVDMSQFDPASIMVYAVPDEVTKGDYSIEWPNRLSKLDKDFIWKKYRKP